MGHLYKAAYSCPQIFLQARFSHLQFVTAKKFLPVFLKDHFFPLCFNKQHHPPFQQAKNLKRLGLSYKMLEMAGN